MFDHEFFELEMSKISHGNIIYNVFKSGYDAEDEKFKQGIKSEIFRFWAQKKLKEAARKELVPFNEK